MVRLKLAVGEKPLYWVGAAKRDLPLFPVEVKDEIGLGFYVAQFGGKNPNAKPWKGEGAGVFEIVEDHRDDTYRAVYTVRFRDAIYVLHAFQKKSPSGIRTSRTDINLIAQRLDAARADYEVRYGETKK
jgi:phage-related protein